MTITLRYRESIFIRKDQLDSSTIDDLTQKYTYRFYADKACKSCQYLQDRHSETCDTCAAYKGGAVLAKSVIINDKPYVSIPIGDVRALKELLVDNGYSDLQVKRHFPDNEFSNPIKFTGTLRPLQIEAVDAILEKKRGVCKAPPRSGKTVLTCAAICKIGKKAIIMASQRDWLVGFLETFIGSKTQIPLTNCSKEKIGFARTYEDFIKYDIALVTTQTFWSEKGQLLLQKVKNFYSVLIVDEVHTSAANKYAGVVSKLNCEYKVGLSGTPSRKDGRFVLAKALIGPNLYDMKIARCVPSVRLVKTKYIKSYRGNVLWPSIVASLEGDKNRLNLIAEWAIKDMQNEHLVLIPMTRINCIDKLIDIINQKAGRKVAYPFYGGVSKKDRDLTIERARDYKIKIIVGNTKLLSTGINIPRASCIYECSLSSNLENCEQRISRILTPWENKPPPIIRIFLDTMNIRRRCLMNEWYNCIMKLFMPIILESDKVALKEYFKAKESNVFDL